MYSYALELMTFKGQQNANVTNKTEKWLYISQCENGSTYLLNGLISTTFIDKGLEGDCKAWGIEVEL